MVTISVNEDGYREVIGCAEGFTESKGCWQGFLSWLKSRGLRGVRMFVGDKAAGMVGSTAGVFPGAKIPALHRALLPQRAGQGPQIEAFAGRGHAQGHPRHGVARGLGGQGRVGDSRARVDEAERGRQGRARRLCRDADVLRDAREHWRRIRTNNAIERLNREIRRRTRVVGTFPDGKSALMLVAARLKYVADSEWGSRRYLDASLLKEQSC